MTFNLFYCVRKRGKNKHVYYACVQRLKIHTKTRKEICQIKYFHKVSASHEGRIN